MNEIKMNRNSNSVKLDLEEVRASELKNEENNHKESYKKLDISENIANAVSGDTVKNSNMVHEKTTEVQDGADEKMLDNKTVDENGSDDRQMLASKDAAVTFIPMSVDQKNGDAKIDMMTLEKSFTGMTKDELMKFANDPFWVRLRWILFVAFWLLWIGMLAGAIYIIYDAPKCSAPKPLAWYKAGPLIVLPENVTNEQLDQIFKHVSEQKIKGVIYDVPGNDTYFLAEKQEKQIKNIVERFKGVHVIVDLTPNYVMQNDPLMVDFIDNVDKRKAFISELGTAPPNNWLNRENQSAWITYRNNHQILSHYGAGRYDLQMSNSIAKTKFMAVLSQLIDWGVRGFRLNNAKHYIISDSRSDDTPIQNPGDATLGTYGYYTHDHTTFQPGLGELMYEYHNFVRNLTGAEGFVSINENLVDPTRWTKKTDVGEMLFIDIPQYGSLTDKLKSDSPAKILSEMQNIYAKLTNSWPQWVDYGKSFTTLNESGLNLFLMLLKGVPVWSSDTIEKVHSDKLFEELVVLRGTPCYMHGDLKYFVDANQTSVGYTRNWFKSGSPGFFVALNPTAENVTANFVDQKELPAELTVNLLSANYAIEGTIVKSKMSKGKVLLSPKSAIMFTYVPI